MKEKRQKKILELISLQPIDNQDELMQALQAEGIKTTQATISRDIRDLGMKKESVQGVTRYVAHTNLSSVKTDSYNHLLSSGILSMETAENLIIIKTGAGIAMAVAAALDYFEIQGLVGSIAGDDTIFLACKSKDITQEVLAQIKKVAYVRV